MLFLPFLTLGCEETDRNGQPLVYSVTFTGADLLIDGAPDLRMPETTGGVANGVVHTKATDLGGGEGRTFGVEPFAVVAVVLLLVGAGSALLPSVRWRFRVAAVAAFLAGLGLLAAVLRTENKVAKALGPLWTEGREENAFGRSLPAGSLYDWFEFRYGFWLAVVTLGLLGFGNALAAVPRRRRDDVAERVAA
jgi:hypothetical protein